MDPLSIAAIIAAIGGVGSSIFGGISENNAHNANTEEMKRIEAERKKGGIDARGNRTYWDPTAGWVTEYGQKDGQLADAMQYQELPLLLQQFIRGQDLSARNNDRSNALMDEFSRITRKNPDDIANLLYASASSGVADNNNKAVETAMRGAARTGTSNIGRVLESINEGSSKALADAAINSKLQGLSYADADFAGRRSDIANLASSFGGQSRASTGGSPSASMLTGGQTAGYATPATFTPIQPNNALANAFGGAAASIGGAANMWAANNANNQTNELLKTFLATGGGFTPDTTGILGTVADRVKKQGSAF